MRNFKYILVIAAAVFTVYANTLHNDFLSDDLPTIVNNPDIARPFAALNVATFTNSINYLAGGFNTFGYHLVNILLHAANAVMVFFLLRLFFAEMPALWGALIFAVHPANTEAVTWISSRLYLLFTFFLLLSFFSYLAATGGARLKTGRLALSLVFYLLALLSSFFPLAFPALLAVYDFTFGRWRRTWKLWPLFFLLAGAKLFMMFAFVQGRAAEIAIDTGVKGWSNPLFNMVYSFFEHSRLLFWPAKLTIYHEPSIISAKALGWEISFFILFIAALCPLYRKAKPLFFAAWLYILFLCPSYSPVMIAWLVAERYLYFASIGFSIAAAFFIDRYLSGSKIKLPAAIVLSVLMAAYALRSIIRNRDWRSHGSLWKATVKASPYSPKAQNNIDDVYGKEGDAEKAAAAFRRAIELKPDYAEAYHNLATTYLGMGRTDEAMLAYQQAVALKPWLYQSHVNLAVIYINKGQRGLARRHLEQAAQLNPGDGNIRELLKSVQ